MPIHPDVPGLNVQILVDGQPLREYDDPDEPATNDHITKYIEAQSGKAFVISYTFDRLYEHRKYEASSHAILDGTVVSRPIFHLPTHWRGPGNWYETVKSARLYKNGKYFEQEMLFTELSIGEGDVRNATKSQRRIDALGEIQVTIKRVTNLRVIEESPSSIDHDAVKKVSEKALKGRAISHSASLGEKKISTPFIHTAVDPIDMTPLVTYTFKYRSRRALESLYVIERASTPPPLEERPIEELSLEETRELLRRQRERDQERETETRRIKQERSLKRERGSPDSVLGDDNLQVVNGTQQKRARKVPDGEIETIDLCGDD